MPGWGMRYVSPDGNSYELLNGGAGTPFIEYDTLSGLVGVFEDTPIESVGVPGARVDFRDRVVKQLEGSFTLVVFDAEQWEQARRDFSPRRHGTLVLESEERFELPVRCSTVLPPPGVVPEAGQRLEVALISDAGVWECSLSSTLNSVTVTNWGDVPVWPEIVWNGAGGPVTLPSGAKFTLPAVTSEHRLPLARNASGKAVNTSTGATLATDAVGESIPVDETRTFITPTSARLNWKIGVLDPWI